MLDHYALAVKSALRMKTKGPAEGKVKKKKKKADGSVEDATKLMESMRDIQTKKSQSDASLAFSAPAPTKTPAEQKFYETQEKRQVERIMKKADKTHKQRVEEFNKHLDSLSEHYDIPKVSWTK